MTNHKSDCAVHNEPAMKAGPCDCGAGIVEAMARAAMIVGNLDWFSEDHIDTVLAKTGHDEDCEDGEYCDFCWANRERAQARAALTAALDHMREPSDAMVNAYHVHERTGSVAGAAWQAMLDQLRKDMLP